MQLLFYCKQHIYIQPKYMCVTVLKCTLSTYVTNLHMSMITTGQVPCDFQESHCRNNVKHCKNTWNRQNSIHLLL